MAVPVPYSPTRITSRIMSTDDVIDLLIDQWRTDDRYVAWVRASVDVIQDRIVTPLGEFERTFNLDGAYGVWLDSAGDILGFKRPGITLDASTDPVFGFGENPDAAGFGRGRFATVNPALTLRQPVGDVFYLTMLKLRAGVIRMSGTIPDMTKIVDRAFPGAYYKDNVDGTIELMLPAGVDPRLRALITELDAWPRPSGIGLTVTAL